jgi:hypothetical protein
LLGEVYASQDFSPPDRSRPLLVGRGPLTGSWKMPEPTRMEVVRRAYELWEQAGKPDGKDWEFYHLAEQELRNEDKSSPLRTPDNL